MDSIDGKHILMTEQISYTQMKSDAFYEVKHFLKRHKQASASRTDFIYLVRHGQTLIGVARVIPQVDLSMNDSTPCFWLRGLFITEPQRKQGIASHLLKRVQKSLSKSHKDFVLVAFPYQHLAQFYQKNGYQATSHNALPLELMNRYQSALDNRKNWLCMHLTKLG
ncbi:MAG: GNAT family N-acetyltransferase [Gammaproteobacteria bacterium]|nr:GNAT family N-acetyltransferase [Gammaproteobacteria bacterium]